ncbi:discoidin domain-containing protein [Streptomyces sp. NPDC054950]
MQTLPRRFGLLFAVAVSLLAFIALPAPSAQAAEVLLSQGKPATASSTEGVFSARSAVDGDLGTRWSSAFADPQWIQVDLGARAEISRVALTWEAAYATSFRIEVSNDAQTWTVLHQTATGAGGAQSLSVSGAGRYVRMYGTQRATAYGYSLWEFQVYGTGGSGADTSRLLSYGRTGAASSPPPALSRPSPTRPSPASRWRPPRMPEADRTRHTSPTVTGCASTTSTSVPPAA